MGQEVLFYGDTGFESFNTVANIWTNFSGDVLPESGDMTSVGKKVVLGAMRNIFATGSVAVLDLSTGQTALTHLANNDDGLETTTNSFGSRAYFAGGEYILLGGGTKAPSTSIDIFTDTTPTAVLSGGLTGSPGHTVTVQLFNTGDAPLASRATLKIYATLTRGVIDGTSTLLGTQSLRTPLAATDNRTLRLRTTLPGTLSAGDYYLVAAVDDGRTVTPVASADTPFKVKAKATPAVRHAIAGAFTRLFRRSNIVASQRVNP